MSADDPRLAPARCMASITVHGPVGATTRGCSFVSGHAGMHYSAAGERSVYWGSPAHLAAEIPIVEAVLAAAPDGADA